MPFSTLLLRRAQQNYKFAAAITPMQIEREDEDVHRLKSEISTQKGSAGAV